MQIVDVHGLLRGLESELISRPVDVSTLYAATRHPGREAVVVVITAVNFAGIGSGCGQFNGGRTSEFAGTQHQRIVQHAALLQVHQKRGDSLIAFAGQLAMAIFQIVVAIPGLTGTMPELHETDAPLQQPAGNQQLARLHSLAVHLPDGLWVHPES